jgi:hypothetical protein
VSSISDKEVSVGRNMYSCINWHQQLLSLWYSRCNKFSQVNSMEVIS